MAGGHDRRNFLRELLRGAAQAAGEVGSALRVDQDELVVEEPYGPGHDVVPAEPARRLASADDLRALCAELDREAWADDAVALARVSVRLTRGGEGASRLGGVAELPPGFEWPVWKGEELALLAQISLDELPPSPLPAAGTLLVFYALSSRPEGLSLGDAGACRVALVPKGPSARTERAADLGELRVLPSAELTLPFAPAPLELDWEEREVWATLQERLAAHQGVELEAAATEYHSLHRLLGHADTLVEGMELDAHLVANGVDLSTGAAYADPRVEELEPGAADWQLLFQLSSDADIGLTLGYYERLTIWIREADLRLGRFDGVRAFAR